MADRIHEAIEGYQQALRGHTQVIDRESDPNSEAILDSFRKVDAAHRLLMEAIEPPEVTKFFKDGRERLFQLAEAYIRQEETTA